MSEIDAVVVTMDQHGLMVPNVDYTLENVGGKYMEKGADLLTYCIHLDAKRRQVHRSTPIMVRVCPIARLDRLRRRGGLPECGFLTRQSPDGDAGDFFCDSAYQIVYEGDRIDRIYFSLCDWSTEPRERAQPLWHVKVDSGPALVDMSDGRWHPLRPIHPDPRVDPGVPIHLRPQSTPRWFYYRNDPRFYDLFKGMVSGSRLWNFLGGGRSKTAFLDDTFQGNHHTRSGNLHEPAVSLAYLKAFPHAELTECGSFPHPRLEAVMASPDAIARDPRVSYASLPDWLRREVDRNAYADWTRGVFEAKTSLDTGERGPQIQPRHLCQLYGEMMCTQSGWADLVRVCLKTGRCRVYRVYCKPGVARALEACLERMIREMTGGAPYRSVIEHESNEVLIKEFKMHATFYNSGDTPRYQTIAWNEEDRLELLRRLEAVDIVAANPHEHETPIALLNVAPEAAEAPTRTENVEAWRDIAYTNKQVSKALSNGDWTEVFRQGVLLEQARRYEELHQRIEMLQSARKRLKRTQPNEKVNP